MRRRNTAREELYERPAYHGLLERIGANVRRLREAKGWSQEEAAFQCGDMASPLLRRIELAATNVTALTLARIAEGLGVDASELLAPIATPLAKRGRGRPKKAAQGTHEGKAEASAVEREPPRSPKQSSRRGT